MKLSLSDIRSLVVHVVVKQRIYIYIYIYDYGVFIPQRFGEDSSRRDVFVSEKKPKTISFDS
jgi:inorganic pyrophosphatase